MAHVYLNAHSLETAVKALLAAEPRVVQVLDRAGKREVRIDHPRGRESWSRLRHQARDSPTITRLRTSAPRTLPVPSIPIENLLQNSSSTSPKLSLRPKSPGYLVNELAWRRTLLAAGVSRSPRADQPHLLAFARAVRRVLPEIPC